MKISFGDQKISEKENVKVKKTKVRQSKIHKTQQNPAAALGKSRTDVLPGQGAEKGKSLIELQQEAANTNVAVTQDYMTLAANTMSAEDYAKMQEEGFDFGSMDPEETVTIVDKIKAELARSGKHIAGYTDDLDMETLTAALGSAALANAVAESFRAADVPLTPENVTAVSQAWLMSSNLQPLNDGSYQYLIDNELQAEIWNLYLAQNSGAGKGGSVPQFYAQNIQGYYAQAANGELRGELLEQVERIIEQAGETVDDNSRRNAEWLLKRGLPLTPENLKHLELLRGLELPVTQDYFAKAAAAAVAEGKSPIYADLDGDGQTVYEKAAEVCEYYQNIEISDEGINSITIRRQVEEIRLRMTAEINVRLLKSGFAIDTAPLEELVEALRRAEQQLAQTYFPGDASAVEKYQLYQSANRVVSDLPGLPADVLGIYAKGQELATLEVFHSEGVALRAVYEKANSSYESLMTVPNSELGDSIQKAFANVDDILRDMGMALTDENRRAVRILGYNRMEMTPANLEAVSTADKKVQSVVEKLTPAATLQMIRDGVNPLEKSLAELDAYFEGQPKEYMKEAESYSRFLYALEQNNSITPEERESFIGIYRLVRQLEKADGAAVGALVNARAEVHFSNLLSAVRSGKVKSLDVKVSDELGAVSDRVRNGASISAQIARAFTHTVNQIVTRVSRDEAATVGYNSEQLETYRETIVSADNDCVAMLQRGQVPVNADNLLAAQVLAQGEDNIFDAADRKRKTSGETVSTQLWEKLQDKADFTKGYEELTGDALEAVKEATFAEADGSLDVRGMQLTYKQLTVAAALVEQEEFFLPMYIGDTPAKVHLTLDKTGEEKGTVDISVSVMDGMDIHVKFSVENGTIHGIFTAESQNEVMKLKAIADNFKEEAVSNWTIGDINVVLAGRGRTESVFAKERSATENSELYRVAKVFLKSLQQGDYTYEN